MPSKTFSFNKTVFLKNLSRFSPLWGLYLGIWLVFLSSTVLSVLEFGETTNYTALGMGYLLMNGGISVSNVITALGGLSAAIAVYSYMYSAKSANMLASLPIRRESMILTSFLSGLVWLLAAPVIALIVTGCIEAAFGVFGAAYLFQLLSVIVMQTVFYFGLATFCAVLTGHIVMLPILFVVFNLLAYVLEQLLSFFFSLITYGLSMTFSNLGRIFSPFVRLLTSYVQLFADGYSTGGVTMSEYTLFYETGIAHLADGTRSVAAVQYGQWGYLACCFAAGIAFAVFAVLIYRKRQMETTSDVIAVAPLRPVFKYCMTFGCAIVLGSILYILFYSGNQEPHLAGFVIAVLSGAFIGYFSSEMLLRKSLRVFNKWRGFAISIVIIVAVIVTFEFDLLRYESKVPLPDSIETATISVQQDDVSFSDAEEVAAVIALHNCIISAKSENKSYPENVISAHRTIDITYALNNGRSLTRSYSVLFTRENLADESSCAGQIENFWNSGDVLVQRMQQPLDKYKVQEAYISWYSGGVPDGMNLSGGQAEDLYRTCIVPDIQDAALGQYSFLEGYIDTDSFCSITFVLYTLDSSGAYEYKHLDIRPTEYSARTNAYLKTLGIDVSSN